MISCRLLHSMAPSTLLTIFSIWIKCQLDRNALNGIINPNASTVNFSIFCLFFFVALVVLQVDQICKVFECYRLGWLNNDRNHIDRNYDEFSLGKTTKYPNIDHNWDLLLPDSKSKDKNKDLRWFSAFE